MSPSLQFYMRAAAETGFPASTLEKVVRLGDLARDVHAHPVLGPALVLKGGSVLNLGFGAPQRLSVDLDYNYIGHVGREAMLTDRPRIESATAELVGRLGYRIQWSGAGFAGRKLFLRYRSASGSEERIEIDLNFLHREPLAGTSTQGLWQPGGLETPRVRVVSDLELCVGKMLALVDRAAARDAYDAGRLGTVLGETLRSRSFRSLFVALSAILEHPLHTYDLARMSRLLTQRDIEDRLLPMLAGDNRPSAEGLLETAWEVLEPFLALEPREREYVEGLHAGELKADLLFPDRPALAERISRHPAVLWKLTNVRNHLRKGR